MDQIIIQYLIYGVIILSGFRWIFVNEWGIGFGIIIGGCLGNYYAFKLLKKKNGNS